MASRKTESFIDSDEPRQMPGFAPSGEVRRGPSQVVVYRTRG